MLYIFYKTPKHRMSFLEFQYLKGFVFHDDAFISKAQYNTDMKQNPMTIYPTNNIPKRHL